MTARSVAEVFHGAPWQAEGSLFSEADLRKTAGLAGAESSQAVGALVESLLTTARDRLLDIPLVDILLGGWLKLRALQAFATEEQRRADVTHDYELAKHKVTSRHAPKVELYVHDIKVADVELDLELSLLIARATLRIRKGRIMEISISGGEATATLKYGKHTLLTREAEKLDFPLTLTLGAGVEIPPPLTISDLLPDEDGHAS